MPVGNPNLDVEDEKRLRRRFIERALEILQSPAKPGTINEL